MFEVWNTVQHSDRQEVSRLRHEACVMADPKKSLTPAQIKATLKKAKGKLANDKSIQRKDKK